MTSMGYGRVSNLFLAPEPVDVLNPFLTTPPARRFPARMTSVPPTPQTPPLPEPADRPDPIDAWAAANPATPAQIAEREARLGARG